LELNLRKILVKCYIWSIVWCGAESWTLEKVDQKYLGSFEIWCWRRIETIVWTDCVRNEVLQRVKKEKNITHTIKRRRANWIGQIWYTNCLLKYVIEGKIEGRIEVTERR
jgi:hypothetical protein